MSNSFSIQPVRASFKTAQKPWGRWLKGVAFGALLFTAVTSAFGCASMNQPVPGGAGITATSSPGVGLSNEQGKHITPPPTAWEQVGNVVYNLIVGVPMGMATGVGEGAYDAVTSTGRAFRSLGNIDVVVDTGTRNGVIEDYVNNTVERARPTVSPGDNWGVTVYKGYQPENQPRPFDPFR